MKRVLAGAILLNNPLRQALAVDLYNGHSSQREPPCGLFVLSAVVGGFFCLTILQTRHRDDDVLDAVTLQEGTRMPGGVGGAPYPAGPTLNSNAINLYGVPEQ